MLPVLMICFLLFELTLVSAHPVDPGIHVYTSKCSRLIKKNPATFELLKLANFPKDVVAKSLHDLLYKQFLHDGADEAEEIADKNEEITENQFKDITPAKLGGVVCKISNKVLKKRGILPREDPHKVAPQFVQDLADASAHYDTSTVAGKWKSLILGYGHFYSRFGLTLDDLAEDITEAYAEVF